MSPPMPTHPAAPFPLAILSIRASPLEILNCTKEAAETLGLPWVEGQSPAADVLALLRLREVEDEVGDSAKMMRMELDELVERSRALEWGGSVLLEYSSSEGGERRRKKAEVLVASSSSSVDGEDEGDTVYSILFLRPATSTSRRMSLAPLDTFYPLRPVEEHPSTLFPQLPSPAFTSPPGSAQSASSSTLPPPPHHSAHTSLSPGIEQMLLNGGTNPFQQPLNPPHSHSATLSPGSFDVSSLGEAPPARVLPPTPPAPDFPFPQQPSEDSLPEDTPTTSPPVRPSLSAASSCAVDLSEDAASPRLSGASQDEDTTERRTSFVDEHYEKFMQRINMSSSKQVYRMPADEAEARETPKPTLAKDVDFDVPLTWEVGEMLVGKRRARRGSEAFGTAGVGKGTVEGRKMSAGEKGELEVAEVAEVIEKTPEERKPLSLSTLIDLVETVPQIMFIADGDGKVVWLSAAWYSLVGGDDRFLIDEQSWTNVFHPHDLEEAFRQYLGAVEDGRPFDFTYRIQDKHGVFRSYACRGNPHRDENGEVDFFFACITDIEELVKTQRQSALVKERTQAVLEGSDLLLLTVGKDRQVSFCEGRRPAFLAEDVKIVGAAFNSLFPNPVLIQAVDDVLTEKSGTVEVETQTNRGGHRYFHRYRLVPLRGDPSIHPSHPDAQAIYGVTIIGRDVTSLVLAEERIERTRAEAAKAQANELAAQEASRLKTEFLTTVSHEIRTPIASILGICELLLAEQMPDEQRRLVEKALQSGENLLDLVGTVLDVRKVETGELKLESAPLLISDVLADTRVFQITAQKRGLEFIEDIQPCFEGLVFADRLRLRQILANALSNAVKFTKEGSVLLRLCQVNETKTRVTVEFIVEDTGVGISKDVLPTLFVPFRQADASTARQYGGSGLGLTIAKQLVELMGGTISLTSPGAGLGSRMTVRVPLRKAPVNGVTTSPSPHPSPAPTQSGFPSTPSSPPAPPRRNPEDVKILLAEDNALIREIVMKTLKRMKFSSFAVKDGRECVEQVEKDDYDVILMDGQMPIMDGYAATAAIRKHSDPRIRKLRIIALTASAIAGDMERCLESGMDGYLAKPVRAKELEAAIWTQLELAARTK